MSWQVWLASADSCLWQHTRFTHFSPPKTNDFLTFFRCHIFSISLQSLINRRNDSTAFGKTEQVKKD
jgi:hypothetical protein